MSGRRRMVRRGDARHGYVLLETVIATGLLVVGLAVIGAQVQDSDTAIRTMERRIRAMMLAQQHLAELDLGLVELDSIDNEQEGDFGPRYPDYGWLLTIDETAVEGMFLLKLQVLHHIREDEYREDDFDFDSAEVVYTVYALRAAPRPLHFAEDLGLNEEELVELSDRLSELGIEGLDAEAFDPAILGKIDFDELLESLPLLLGAFGIDVGQLSNMLPPNLLEQLQNSGLLDEAAAERLQGAMNPDRGAP